MPKITIVLFDVDGTLLDTKELIYSAFEHTFRTLNETIPPRESLQVVVGKPLFQCYEILSGKNEVSSYCELHHEYQLANIGLSKPFTNAASTLQELKKRSYKIAAVTSRKKQTTHKTLEQAGLTNFIDFAVYADEVVNHKPHPEALQKAMDFLGSSPDETIMVGDSEADILGGKNAGTKTIGALYGFQGEKLRAFLPDYAINDIEEILKILDGQS